MTPDERRLFAEQVAREVLVRLQAERLRLWNGFIFSMAVVLVVYGVTTWWEQILGVALFAVGAVLALVLALLEAHPWLVIAALVAWLLVAGVVSHRRWRRELRAGRRTSPPA